MSSVRIELDDGTIVEGIVEGSMDEGLGATLAAGPIRIALEPGEVEGHELSSIVRLIVSGPDDTEGHALSLHLPDAKAARDLERRLIVAGALIGVVTAGAVTATLVVPSVTSPQAPAVTVEAPIPAPAWANPAVRDRGAEDGVAPLVPPAWVNPGVRDGSLEVTAPIPAPAAANPAVRDRGTTDGVAPLVPPDSANPLVRDGAATGDEPIEPATTQAQNPRAR